MNEWWWDGQKGKKRRKENRRGVKVLGERKGPGEGKVGSNESRKEMSKRGSKQEKNMGKTKTGRGRWGKNMNLESAYFILEFSR